MELKSVDLIKSENSSDRLRLIGEVCYDNPDFESEYFWFDIEENYAEYINRSGSPWLVCLIPLAATLKEPLKINVPVDPFLFENVHEVMRIWKRWYPDIEVIKVEAPFGKENHCLDISGKGASLFSGGVDSFSTVLRHNSETHWPGKKKIDDLLYIWGFDIPLSNPEAFKKARNVLRTAAVDLGKELVDIHTNLRETRWPTTNWRGLSHACFLASVGLILEAKYNFILIPSTYSYEKLKPLGSHPLTDPLLSTRRCSILHDGAAYDRIDKTDYISESDVANRSLKVCWDSQSDENCQACSKCYRTMSTLFILGKLDKCKTLDVNKFKLSKMRQIYLSSKGEKAMVTLVRDFALLRGQKEVAKAIDSCIKRNAWAHQVERVIRYLKRHGRAGWLVKLLERFLTKVLPGVRDFLPYI